MVCSQMIDLSTIVMSLDAPMLVCCHKRFKPAHRDLNNNGSKSVQKAEFAIQQPEACVEETKFPIRAHHTKKEWSRQSTSSKIERTLVTRIRGLPIVARSSITQI